MTQIYTQAFISPLHEQPPLFPQHHHQSQYVPRSNDFNLSSPSHSDNNSRAGVAQPHSPMSDSRKGLFEVTSPKVGDMYRSRPEGSQPREQLPSLSSLFAGAPARPSSAYSNRHSPTFPTGSPKDSHHPSTPLHSNRSFETSYFQPRTTLDRPLSYGSRPEQTDRPGLPPPQPRSALPGQRPESPRYDARHTIIDAPRAPYSTNNWSPRSQSSRPEFVGRDTSSSFRTHVEHLPPSHRPETKYLESHNAQVPPNYPPTPSSTAAGDSATTKDGLGPKIWTGTHFLPRFVRQAEVPGEGMCYFYDDGTHCKTVIDGEIVNAHWGVTKAGKPRKRLAIACITCREKKIKCDPDYPRCIQCEKFGRVCKFKNAPRGGQGSPDTPPADPEESLSRPGSSREDGESFREKRDNSQSISPRQVLRHDTPDSEARLAKRQRTGYNDFTPVPSEGSPRPSVQQAPSPSTPFSEPFATSTIDPNLIREWHTNPYSSNPGLVTELVSVFFRYVPETANCMFAESPFTSWVLSATEKSSDDLMLIYTILSLASVFAPKSEHRVLGSQYSAISRFACENRPFSIQLVQSRLLLALYFFAHDQSEMAWDLCGGAVRAASGLKLNLEIEKTEDVYRKTFPYGLNRSGFAECRRRTFWSCYLMDSFNGFCSGHMSVIHPEDIFLRLPCDLNSFQTQAEVQNPFFDPQHFQNTKWTMGSMAYLINITTIWGDVMANIYRTTQRPSSSSSTTSNTFPSFYETTSRRLQSWKSSLPSEFIFNPENVKRAAANGKLGTFMTMHSVYHTIMMKLNRYIPHFTISPTHLAHHQSVGRQAAEDLIAIMNTQVALRPQLEVTRFSSPFVGYAIVSAIDILTAKFTVASLPDLLARFKGAHTILAELAVFWQSSKNQAAIVQQRITDVMDLERIADGQHPVGRVSGSMHVREGICEMMEPLERMFDRQFDSVYA